MANEKKYMEVMSDGSDDFYVRDQEAQSSIVQLQQKLEGPYYDAEHRCIVYPDYETANYNPATRGIYL